MKKLMRTQFLFCLFLLSLILHSRPATSQEAEDEREFTYVDGSENGPQKWGEIHPEWEMCNKGDMQSPIDLMNERVADVSHLGKLEKNYKPSNATIKNRGHDIMVRNISSLPRPS